MANNSNLRIPTSEEAREIGRKGGIASGIARQRRKTLKEELLILLDLIDEEGKSNNEKISLSIIKQALEGNVKAYEVIRDTIGEKPIDKVEQVNPPVIKIERPDKNECI